MTDAVAASAMLPVLLTEAALRETNGHEPVETLLDMTVELRPIGAMEGGVSEHGSSHSIARSAYNLRLRGENEAALRAYKRAIHSDAKNYFARFNHGFLLERCGLLDEALDEFRVAASLAPADWAPAFNAGIVLLRLGSPEEAADALSSAVERSQDPAPEILYARSIARRQAGDFAGAASDAASFRAKALDVDEEDGAITVADVVAKARQADAHKSVKGAAKAWGSGKGDAQSTGTGADQSVQVEALAIRGLPRALGKGKGGIAMNNMLESSSAAQVHAAIAASRGVPVAISLEAENRARRKRQADSYAISQAFNDFSRRSAARASSSQQPPRAPLATPSIMSAARVAAKASNLTQGFTTTDEEKKSAGRGVGYRLSSGLRTGLRTEPLPLDAATEQLVSQPYKPRSVKPVPGRTSSRAQSRAAALRQTTPRAPQGSSFSRRPRCPSRGKSSLDARMPRPATSSGTSAAARASTATNSTSRGLGMVPRLALPTRNPTEDEVAAAAGLMVRPRSTLRPETARAQSARSTTTSSTAGGTSQISTAGHAPITDTTSGGLTARNASNAGSLLDRWAITTSVNPSAARRLRFHRGKKLGDTNRPNTSSAMLSVASSYASSADEADAMLPSVTSPAEAITGAASSQPPRGFARYRLSQSNHPADSFSSLGDMAHSVASHLSGTDSWSAKTAQATSKQPSVQAARVLKRHKATPIGGRANTTPNSGASPVCSGRMNVPKPRGTALDLEQSTDEAKAIPVNPSIDTSLIPTGDEAPASRASSPGVRWQDQEADGRVSPRPDAPSRIAQPSTSNALRPPPPASSPRPQKPSSPRPVAPPPAAATPSSSASTSSPRAAPSSLSTIRPAATRQLRPATALVYASGRIFAPFAIRPNELTATTASLIARCAQMLPSDPLREQRKERRMQKRQEAMRKARMAQRARMRGDSPDLDSPRAASSPTRTATATGGVAVNGDDSETGNGSGSSVVGGGLQSTPSDASVSDATVVRGNTRRRSLLERGLPESIAKTLGVKPGGAAGGGANDALAKLSAGTRRLRFTDAETDFLVTLTRSVKAFSSLPLSVHQRLCRELRFLVVPARKVLFRQGKPSDDRLFIVVQGAVDVHMKLRTARKTRQRRIQTAMLAHRWVKAFRSRATARNEGDFVPMPLAPLAGSGEGLKIWKSGRGAALANSNAATRRAASAAARAAGGEKAVSALPGWASTIIKSHSRGADGTRLGQEADEREAELKKRAAIAKRKRIDEKREAKARAKAQAEEPLWLQVESSDDESTSDLSDEDAVADNMQLLRGIRGDHSTTAAGASAGTVGHETSLGTLLGSLFAGEAFGGEVLAGVGRSSGRYADAEALRLGEDGQRYRRQSGAFVDDRDATKAAVAAKTRRDSAFAGFGGRIGVEFNDHHMRVKPAAAAVRAASNRDAAEQEVGAMHRELARQQSARKAAVEIAESQDKMLEQEKQEQAKQQRAVGPSAVSGLSAGGKRFRRVTVSTREDTFLLTLTRDAYSRVLLEVRKAMLDDVSDFLGKVSLFEALNKEELRRLAERTEHRRLRSGQMVVQQDERVEGLFFLRAGRCAVRQVITHRKPTRTASGVVHNASGSARIKHAASWRSSGRKSDTVSKDQAGNNKAVKTGRALRRTRGKQDSSTRATAEHQMPGGGGGGRRRPQPVGGSNQMNDADDSSSIASSVRSMNDSSLSSVDSRVGFDPATDGTNRSEASVAAGGRPDSRGSSYLGQVHETRERRRRASLNSARRFSSASVAGIVDTPTGGPPELERTKTGRLAAAIPGKHKAAAPSAVDLARRRHRRRRSSAGQALSERLGGTPSGLRDTPSSRAGAVTPGSAGSSILAHSRDASSESDSESSATTPFKSYRSPASRASQQQHGAVSHEGTGAPLVPFGGRGSAAGAPAPLKRPSPPRRPGRPDSGTGGGLRGRKPRSLSIDTGFDGHTGIDETASADHDDADDDDGMDATGVGGDLTDIGTGQSPKHALSSSDSQGRRSSRSLKGMGRRSVVRHRQSKQSRRASDVRRKQAEMEEMAVLGHLTADRPIGDLLGPRSRSRRNSIGVAPMSTRTRKATPMSSFASITNSGSSLGSAAAGASSSVDTKTSSEAPTSAATGLEDTVQLAVQTASSSTSAVPLGVRVQAAMLTKEKKWKRAGKKSRWGGVESRAVTMQELQGMGTASGSDSDGQQQHPMRGGAKASGMMGLKPPPPAHHRPHAPPPQSKPSGAGGAPGIPQGGMQRPQSGPYRQDSRVSSGDGETTEADEVEVLELGTLMPGDCFGESVALSTRPTLIDKAMRSQARRQAQDLLQSGVHPMHLPQGHPLKGYSLTEVQILARQPEEAPGLPASVVAETLAPASVLCETAVEVLLLRRRDIYDCLSFQSRQKVREAALSAPVNRAVTTSGQRLRWQRFREQVAADARSHSSRSDRYTLSVKGFR